MFSTHPPGGPPVGDAGKGSNEAWAAREAYEPPDRPRRRRPPSLHDHQLRCRCRLPRASLRSTELPLPDRQGPLPDVLAAGHLQFATTSGTSLRPLRIPDGLSGINRLSNLVLPGSVKFPTSCYSLSWQMLHEVDYWDEEVIPEDWHLFLKCSYTLGDRVHVEVALPAARQRLRPHRQLHEDAARALPPERPPRLGRERHSLRLARSAEQELAARAEAQAAARRAPSRRCTPSGWRSGTSSRSGTHLPIFAHEPRRRRTCPSGGSHAAFKLPGPSWHLGDLRRGTSRTPSGRRSTSRSRRARLLLPLPAARADRDSSTRRAGRDRLTSPRRRRLGGFRCGR